MMRIGCRRANVLVRADFQGIGSYDQVGRALRQLVLQGRLMKIGFGIYARAARHVTPAFAV